MVRTKASEEIYQNEMRTLYNMGLSDREIYERMGIRKQNVYTWRKKNNLKPNIGERKIGKRKPSELNPDVEAKAKFFMRSLVWADKAAKEQGKKLDVDMFLDYWRLEDGDKHMMRKVMGL